MNKIPRSVITIIVTILSLTASPYSIHRYTNDDGLSNSAILSLSQDDRGFLWIGSCDGLDIYNGRTITPFTSMANDAALSGRLITAISEGPDDSHWIMTPYGLNLVLPNTPEVAGFNQFREHDYLSTDDNGVTYVLTTGNALYYSIPDPTRTFTQLMNTGLTTAPRGITAMGDRLIVFADDGIYRLDLNMSDNNISVRSHSKIDDIAIKNVWIHNDDIFMLLQDDELVMYDAKNQSITIGGVNLSDLSGRFGEVKDIVRNAAGQFFVGFNNGVLRIDVNDADHTVTINDIGINCAIFCLYPDRHQDIIWIGTDGQGLYAYANDDYSSRSVTYEYIDASIKNPIRAIYLDDNNTLWLGTKGDGLIKIENFDPWKSRNEYFSPKFFNTGNSRLLNNSVYAVCAASDGGMWIGSDEGIDYKPEGSDNIVNIQGGKNVKYVHGIIETADCKLWIATVGMGIIKASITYVNGLPSLDIERKYSINNGNLSSNFFFAMAADKQGNIWCGNRGHGLFKISSDGEMRNVALQGSFNTRSVNDIYAVHCDNDDMWVGTGYGLFRISPDGQQSWIRNNGFPDSSIHSLITDNDGNIWASTNHGLVYMDKVSGNYRIFGKYDGLGVNEYSDGAVYRAGNTLIFGGINGVSFIKANPNINRSLKENYRPTIELANINIAGKDIFMGTAVKTKGNESIIHLSPDQNTFSISFVIPDFLNGNNYSYLYRIGDKGDWKQLATPGSISFTSMPHGTYNLQIKAVDPLTSAQTEVHNVIIDIDAPWYATNIATLIYIMIAAALMILIWLKRREITRERQQEMLRQLEREHKEQTYEEKLRFFTNITHEFCTPLTLIYGPCERLLSYTGSDNYVRNYASLIKNNTERLNSLIQEIIDFRRAETGHQNLKIQRIDISGLCNDIVSSFTYLREQQNVKLETDIAHDLQWNTDYSCFTKIIYNLISNAFKYTPAEGTIRVSIKRDGELLLLSVYNTGRGIKKADMNRIFNRYSVLDNIEENATRGLSARNGLGLAICQTMTELLKGSIKIQSEVNEYAEFIVSLPKLEADSDEVAPTTPNIPSDMLSLSARPATGGAADAAVASVPGPAAGQEQNSGDDEADNRPRILVIDDNPDILTLLYESLPEFNVVTAPSADKGIEIVRNGSISLIITDIMMPGIDGLELTRQIKQDPYTRHIPLIILSSRNATDDKISGLESGADAYIPKPFTLSYLRAVIVRLMRGKDEMAEYYNTASSAYKYHNGQIVDKEATRFVDQLDTYIDANIDSDELSAESLAAHMQTSTRNLYRKMKELDLLPPNDYIKEHRMSFATKLLVTTNLTIQEIIYRCGFNNRSHFYKEFDKRHGMTPKDYRQKHKAKPQ